MFRDTLTDCVDGRLPADIWDPYVRGCVCLQSVKNVCLLFDGVLITNVHTQ